MEQTGRVAVGIKNLGSFAGTGLSRLDVSHVLSFIEEDPRTFRELLVANGFTLNQQLLKLSRRRYCNRRRRVYKILIPYI
jgi:hypothetical protein